MHFINRKNIIFWGINIFIAFILFLLIGMFAFKQLDRYTRHGYFLTVPDLRGETPEKAVPLAGEKNLQIIIIDSIYDNTALPGVVVEQFPTPGSKIKSQRKVHLTINAKTPEKVLFPNLRNTSFRQAIQRIAALGFKLGNIVYAHSDFPNLVLDFQLDGEFIEPGNSVQKGAVVDIVLGDGNQVREIPVPILIGKTLREARILLLSSYLNLGDISVDNTLPAGSDRENAFVCDQSPYPYSTAKISRGGFISVHLSKDARKVIKIDSPPDTDKL